MATNTGDARKQTLISKLTPIARDAVAALIWAYVLLKLFVFDIDVYFFTKFFPNEAWLLDLKFVFLIGIMAILAILFRRSYGLAALYLLFFPLVVILWKIPFFIFRQKSWVLAFAFLNSIFSFFISFKYNLITFALFLICFSVTVIADNKILLASASAGLFALVLLGFVRKFISVFKPTAVFKVYNKVFSAVNKHIESTSKIDDDLRNLPVATLSSDQLAKWSSKLQTPLIFNRICLFAARRLRDYQRSGLSVVSSVLVTLALVASTTVCFAAINYALFKIDPLGFAVTTTPTPFTFTYYSFNTFLLGGVPDLQPVSVLSETAAMAEKSLALFLSVIFVSLLISTRTERHAKELDGAISDIEAEGHSMEQFVRTEYGVNTIEDAIAELEKIKVGTASLVIFLSKGIT